MSWTLGTPTRFTRARLFASAMQPTTLHVFVAVLACTLLVLILIDAFETVVVARRTQRTFRITRVFYRITWTGFCALALRIRSGKKREHFLGIYGPISLIPLLGCWASGMIIAFTLLHCVAGLEFNGVRANFLTDLYFSGGTLFTLAPSDPSNMASKYLAVIEAGLGFSLLGLVIGYLPVFYQSFANRELPV